MFSNIKKYMTWRPVWRSSSAPDYENEDRQSLLSSPSSSHKSHVLLLTLLLILSTLLIAATVHILTLHATTIPAPFDVPTMFTAHPSFEAFDETGDFMWENLIPPNGGFLIADNGGERDKFGITMYHQLHCLIHLRKQTKSMMHELQNRDKVQEKHDIVHIGHCFDFLRQSLMCMADGTIERPKWSQGTELSGYKPFEYIDGLVMHQCRDPEKLYDLSMNSGFLLYKETEYSHPNRQS